MFCGRDELYFYNETYRNKVHPVRKTPTNAKLKQSVHNAENAKCISAYIGSVIYYSAFESSILRPKLANWRNSQYKETHMDRYFKLSCQISVYNLILIEFYNPKGSHLAPKNYHIRLKIYQDRNFE